MRATAKLVRLGGIAAIGVVGAVLPMQIASAETYPSGGNPPEVAPNTQTHPSSQPPTEVEGATAVNGAAAAKSPSSTLPFTGADVAELAAVGGAAVGVGYVLVRRSRRVRTTA